jgi:hypothetical protein
MVGLHDLQVTYGKAATQKPLARRATAGQASSGTRRGEIVSGHNIARLVETLYAYFRSVGRSKSRESLHRQVEKYLSEHSLPDAEGISPTRLPVTVNLPLLDELRLVNQELRRVPLLACPAVAAGRGS